MALSTELLKRLNTSEEPLPKRLKLAENVFHATDLPLGRREDLIFSWLCKTCPDNPKVWNTLESCLQQDQLDIKGQIKQTLIQFVMEHLAKNPQDISESVLHCFRLLISNKTMQQYFSREPQSLGQLIKSLLISIYDVFKNILHIEEVTEGIDVGLINEKGGLALVAYTTLINIMESFLQIYKAAYSTKDELRSVFVQDILYPLCRIIDHKCTDNTNRLGVAAHKCIQQIVFGKKSAQNKSCEKEEHIITEISIKLAEISKESDHQTLIMSFVLLFRAAAGIYKGDTATLDFIFRHLVNGAGTYKKETMSGCLKYTNDITFDFEHKINDTTLFTFCQEIVNDILCEDNLEPIDYNLLTQLLYFNPLIIERKVQDILSKILLQKRTIQWTDLLIAILDASIRLRKEEKLFSQILISLKNSMSEPPAVKIKNFFPCEFKEKVIKMANNITSSQIIVILRTLIFHLNTHCPGVLEEPDHNILIMKATIELLVCFFDGICVFEYKGSLLLHEKLIAALTDLGNVLDLLVEKAQHLNYNKTIILLLLSATESWNKVRNTLKYYVSKVSSQTSSFPISQSHWQQLVQRIANFGDETTKNIMNKLILHRNMSLRNSADEEPFKLNSLVGGLEHFWSALLKHNCDIVSSVTAEEMTKVTSFLLADITSNKDNYDTWVDVLRKDQLQECRNFVVSLLGHILIQLGDFASTGTTKSTAAYVDINKMLETETNKAGEMDEIITAIQEELSKNKFEVLDKSTLKKMNVHLKLLLQLPLTFLSPDIRVLVFLIIYALRKECSDSNQKSLTLCDNILSDLLERPGIDVCKYLSPPLLITDACQSKSFQKAIELSFRSTVPYEYLKKLVKSSTGSMDTMYLLLESIETAQVKTNPTQKSILKKAEKKLIPHIRKVLTADITSVSEMKALTLITKLALSEQKLDDDLKNIAELALSNIFKEDNQVAQELKEQTENLAIIMLRSRKTFVISEETIRQMWLAMLDRPSNDLLLLLSESSETKGFQKLLELLHVRLMNSLNEKNYEAQNNIFTIWKAILKTDMSSDRNKLRLLAITKLLQDIQSSSIATESWSGVLKLLCNILTSKHLHLPGSLIDASILLGLKAVEEVRVAACDEILTICGILVKIRASLISDRLPILLLLYRRIINVVVTTSKTTVDMSEQHTLRCLAVNLEKFTSSLIKMKKDLVRLAPYLIADLLELSVDASVAPYVKVSMQNCISQFISICDQHGIALLSRTLPVAMQEIFKTQVDNFNKFYKFSGKI